MGNQSVDDFDDLILLTARESGNRFKSKAGFSDGSGFLRGGFVAEEFVYTDVKGACELGENVAAWRFIPLFPKRDIGLSDLKFSGELILAKTRSST